MIYVRETQHSSCGLEVWDKQPGRGSDNICDNVKIKMGFYSDVGKATMKSNGHQCREEKILEL